MGRHGVRQHVDIGTPGKSVLHLFIGVLLLAAVVFNLSMLPYPIWFKILNLLAIPAAILLGDRSSIRSETPGANARLPRSA